MAQTQERFLKMKSGAVYHYSERLAKRPDALVVDGYAAAEYYRSIGSDNEVTKAYPKRVIDSAIPDGEPPVKPKPQRKKATRGARNTKVVVSEEENPTELQELLGKDGANLL